jgi:hypothetical protein
VCLYEFHFATYGLVMVYMLHCVLICSDFTVLCISQLSVLEVYSCMGRVVILTHFVCCMYACRGIGYVFRRNIWLKPEYTGVKIQVHSARILQQ